MSGEASSRRHLILVALVALAAYLPALFGGYVYDDDRFVEENEAVHHLSAGGVVSYFTDPSTMAKETWRGIYRPIRTLDFAIDWTIGGGRPWFFHLRNMLYHAIAAMLLYLLIRALGEGGRGPGEGAALFGALAWALHPVQTESVAWITSRGDVILAVAFLGALLLHLRGRRVAATVVLVVALFSKEAAVVFPAAVFLCDRLRGDRPAWRWYAIYAALCAGYTAFWMWFIGGGTVQGMGHLETWWGGSYGANLLTMSKGFLYYAGELIFPIRLTIDYHVPVASGLHLAEAVSIACLLALAAAAWAGGPRSRFAVLWFLVLILPTSNLLRPIGIPTAERFLYLPSVGLAVWAGPLLARYRGGIVVLACFLVLTFARTIEWRSDMALFASVGDVDTPRTLGHRAELERRAAVAALERRDRARPSERPALLEEAREHARRCVELADRFLALYERDIRLSPGRGGASLLATKANALNILGEFARALEAADASIKLYNLDPDAYYHAAAALDHLGRYPDAAVNAERAVELGYEDDISRGISALWLKAARQAEEAGDMERWRRFLERRKRWQ